MKTRRDKRDDQVREFEKRDLGKDIERSRSAVVIRPKNRALPASILLDSSLVDKLKEKAEEHGIGYQTMLKSILQEHVDDH